MVRHLHITKLDQLQASSDIQSGSLITRDAIFFDDVCLRHRGELRAYKLKEDHVPTFLEKVGGFSAQRRCIDYLDAAQEADAAWTIHELFPDHYWHEDFDEVPIAHDTWQPQIDSLQSQITDIVNVYSTDDERIQYLATQLASGGLIFDQVDAKVLIETQRAQVAEGVNTTAIGVEKARAEAAEAAIELFFEGTNTDHDNDRAQIKLDFAAGDATNAAAVSSEESRAQGVEAANAAAVVVQKDRIDAILNLSSGDLDTFKEIEEAYKAADSSVETTVTNLVNARVTIATYNTDQAVQDLAIGVNSNKTSYGDAALVASHTVDIAANTASVGTKYATSVAEAKHILQDALITTNSNKISYDDSTLVASHTVDIAANSTSVATKYSTSDATAKHLAMELTILQNATDVAAEETRAEAAELVLTTAVASKYATSDATTKHLAQDGSISTNAAAVVTEKSRAEAAELVLTTSVASKYSTSDATAKHLAMELTILQNATDVAAEETRAEAAELVLTTAVASKYTTTVAEAKHVLQDALILNNTGKVTYGDAALVASHTSSIAANTASVATKYATSVAEAKHVAMELTILQNATDIAKVTSGTYVTSSGGAVTVGANSVVIINHESGAGNQLITLPTPVVVGKQVKILFTKNNANYHWKLQAGGSDTISGAVMAVDSSATPDVVTYHASNGEGDNHLTLKNTTRCGTWLDVVGTSTSNWAMNGVVVHAADAPGWG